MLERIEDAEEKYAYRDRRAEMYGMLSLLMDPDANPRGFAIPNEVQGHEPVGGLVDEPHFRYKELHRQLAVVPKFYDQGRLFLPPKNPKPGRVNESREVTMHGLLGCSPDESDALVLAVYGLQCEMPQVVAGRAF